MTRIPAHIIGGFLLFSLLPFDVTAQGFGAGIAAAAEGLVSGALARRPGPSFRFMLGGRSKSDLAVNGGIHYWRHAETGRQVALLTFLASVSQTLGPASRPWRPVVGGRLEYGLYDPGSEPYGAGEWGLEIGLEHRLGGGGAIQLLVLPSYLTLIDGPSGVVLGLELRVTHRNPD
jgi:hypothetical protein